MKPQLNDVVNVRVFKEQYKDIRQVMKLYPDLWASESHFIRSSISYFVRHVKEGKFKITIE